jgi:hypothetical protein
MNATHTQFSNVYNDVSVGQTAVSIPTDMSVVDEYKNKIQ